MKKKLLFLLSLLSALTIGVASATACDNGKNNPPASNTGTESDSGTESGSDVTKTYTVKFVDEDGTELSTATYEEGATVTAPADPTKADADGYSYAFAGWDKEVTVANADVTYTATYTKTAIEYTITFMDGEDVVAEVPFTVETTEIEVPAVPVKPGYENGAWGAYDLTKLENQTVTLSGYTIAEYKITFVNGEDVVAEVPFTVETTEIQVPALPEGIEREHYTYAWGAYDLKDYKNQTVEVVYTPIEYKVEFVNDEGFMIAPTVKFTVENVGDVVFPDAPKDYQKEGYTAVWTIAPQDLQLQNYTATVTWSLNTYTLTFIKGEEEVKVPFNVEMTEIEEPELPTKAHYTASWGKYDLKKGEDQTVEVIYEATKYKISFMFGTELVAEEFFTIEDNEITEPAIPTLEGFEGGEWDEYDTARFEDQTVQLINFTASSYTLTFDANGGSSEALDLEVTFGEAYELPIATTTAAGQYFNGWADENGNLVPQTGTWKIASSLTLKAVYSNVMSFTDGVVPAAFTKADTTASLDIVNINGNNVLKLNNPSSGSPAMKVTTAWLAEYFADENVDYIAFDAIADMANNNFRRDTNRDGALTAVTYEQDMTYDHDSDGDGTKEKYPTTGVRADAWKTFYFSRADYEFWVSKNLTEARFIASGGFSAGQNIYIDNIRPVTEEERQAGIGSFESAGIRINDAGKTLLFYTLGQGTTWQFNMQVSAGVFANVGLTNDNVTDGRTALTFTKEAGKLAINLTSGRAWSDALVTTTGYWAVDVYVPVGAGATISSESTGLGNSVIPCGVPTEGAWTTVYLNGSINALKIDDQNGGTYCIDNFRTVTAEEFTAAQYGFEVGTVGLRTNLLNDENTASGAAYVYYKGKDYSGVKASLVVSEGNGAGDVNALSNVRFDNQVVHSGDYSLAFDKGAGYMFFSRHVESSALTNFAGGFTFWIYSTVEINGVDSNQVTNGVNGKVGGTGIIIPANTWTQITINADEIGNGRFLILQGSFTGTIYVDDFQLLN